ncbi:MAG: nitrate- and nitrite sensing domain-containing protein [Actinomycetota bacterium]
MRSRLVLLIAIPTLTAIVLGGIRIGASAQSAVADQRVEKLATLSGQVAGLAQALETERNDVVQFIVLGTNGGRDSTTSSPELSLEKGVLKADYARTDALARSVRSQAGSIGGDYPRLVQQEAQNALSAINGIPQVRNAATGSKLPSLVVIDEYASTINETLALNDEIALGSNDSALADSVRVLGLVSRMKEEASEQAAVLTSALSSDLVGQGDFGPDKIAAIQAALAEQNSNLAQFNISATTEQRQLFQSALSSPFVDSAQANEAQAISLASSSAASSGSPTNTGSSANPVFANAATAMVYPVQALRHVEETLVNSITTRAGQLRNDAITSAVVVGIAVILVLILALAFTTIVGRSMVRPLRRLRAGALEVAGIRLPETVRRMSEADGEDMSLDVEPIDVDSADEIGEVARAFDQVHREALRLAANEAALRGNVNAMFVNLSRRSQSLVERQIQLIDELELGEQDAERLSSLFQMDHLATRMRRNSENLLVLAGHDVSRRRNQPVALVDVLRAAVSEIEQYERVTLNVQPGIAVRGPAVNDVVHLISELAENATSFSSAETPVNVSGHLLNSGGVLLDITDQGVGMGAEEMAHANWRLDNPPVVDVAVSRRMGLFVVARLAARHGIRVRLRPAASGGLTALVWLPDEAVSHDGDGDGGSRRPGMEAPPAQQALSGGQTGAFSSTGFATAGPAPAGSVAGVFSTGEWGASERSSAEEAVTAARTPKFAPLRADADAAADENGMDSENGSGLPFRTTPQPADQQLSPSYGAGPPSPSGIPPEQSMGQDGYGSGQNLFSPSGAGPYSPQQDPAAFAPSADAYTGNGAAETFAPSADTYPTDAGGAYAPDAGGYAPAADSYAAVGGQDFGGQGGDFGQGGDAYTAASGPFASNGDSDGFSDGFAASGDTRGQQPVLGAPSLSGNVRDDRPAAAAPDNGLSSRGWSPGSSAPGATQASQPSGVVVPPPASLGEEHRLPIFESVESDWFRRGRHAVAGATPGPEQEAVEAAPSSWTSPADEGWRAAQVVSAPSSDGLTSAGLPKRVPKANLVPGAAAGSDSPPTAPAPVRSAAVTRERFASFQRGAKEGRAIRRGADAPDGADDGDT